MKYYKAKMPEAWARMKWCEDQFGPENPLRRIWDPYQPRWYRNGGYIHFRDKQDYVLYLLRWS